MRTHDLEDLAARITAPLRTTPGGARFSGIVPPTIDLLARGEPVLPEEIAAAAGKSAEEVRAALGQMASVEWDEHGRVVGAGLTLRPTPHRFAVGDRTLFTWCALDALIFPALLDRPASVESPCRGTGELVRVEVTPTAIEAVDPPPAVVSVVEPSRDLTNLRGVFCENVHFFSSSEAASRWLAEHPGATLLSVEEAFRLGQLIAEGFSRPPQ